MPAKDHLPADPGKALRDSLISENETDSNLEPANVVDGLFAIARAIDRLSLAIGSARPTTDA